MNSANDEVSLNGLATPEAKKTITEWLEKKGLGRFKRESSGKKSKSEGLGERLRRRYRDGRR